MAMGDGKRGRIAPVCELNGASMALVFTSKCGGLSSQVAVRLASLSMSTAGGIDNCYRHLPGNDPGL